MKNYKGSYTMRRDAYWKDYYPSLKFISSALIFIEVLLIVILTVVLIGTVFAFRVDGFQDDPAIIAMTVVLWIVIILLIHIILTYQREMIRLKVDRNFMLYEIDQKTLKPE